MNRNKFVVTSAYYKLQDFKITLGPFLRIGTSNATSPQEMRVIVLSNKLSIGIFLLSIFLFVAYAVSYPPNFITIAIPIGGLISGVTLLLNYFNKTTFARFWLSLLPPAFCLFVSIVFKLKSPEGFESEFYEFRYIMVGMGILPLALLLMREKTLLWLSMSLNLLAVLLFDPLHNAFGVGYYQLGHHDTTYYFGNVVILVTYLILVGSAYLVKKSNEASHDRNLQLIEELNNAKEALEERNSEIEAQNQEIVSQSEVLSENQIKLEQAFEIIKSQKELLTHANLSLENELLEKNKELTQTNSELIRYNNELRQFSFTVSHNLRGPVASLLGLVNIIDLSTVSHEQKDVLKHIQSTTQSLDEIISDLNKIIDIRYDIFKVRQRINISDALREIKKLFIKKLDANSAIIEEHIHCHELYSVKPMVHSIIYNLVSNSVKYRSNERPLKIEIDAVENETHYVISVTDNGLGINLERYRENLFKLYKRFHYHIDGKGIGLYLVKLQCESLGGHIEVESELNKFTRFTVYLPKPENIARQILYDEPHAQIFFDAIINSTGVIWNGPITGDQYRSVFNKCIEFLKHYNTPNWISDLTHQGHIEPEDQRWMFQEIIPAAVDNGLKRIGVVRTDVTDEQLQGYVKNIKNTLDGYIIKQQYFTSIDLASRWIQDENEKTLNSTLN